MLVSSFPPIVGENPRILLLGSMPGAESLRQVRYYAHPRNLFWPILGELVGARVELSYFERVDRLKAAGIAVWDCLKHCEREGSLDSRIRPDTEIPNELDVFLGDHPTLSLVGFNGRKSADTFQRWVLPVLDHGVLSRLSFVTLPSTSPANASQSWDDKFDRWRAALAPYLPGPAVDSNPR